MSKTSPKQNIKKINQRSKPANYEKYLLLAEIGLGAGLVLGLLLILQAFK